MFANRYNIRNDNDNFYPLLLSLWKGTDSKIPEGPPLKKLYLCWYKHRHQSLILIIFGVRLHEFYITTSSLFWVKSLNKLNSIYLEKLIFHWCHCWFALCICPNHFNKSFLTYHLLVMPLNALKCIYLIFVFFSFFRLPSRHSCLCYTWNMICIMLSALLSQNAMCFESYICMIVTNRWIR